MRQNQYAGLSSVLFNSRLIIISSLLLLGIHTQAFASGAKMPNIATTTAAQDGAEWRGDCLAGATRD